jgi:hypothetical protein
MGAEITVPLLLELIPKDFGVYYTADGKKTSAVIKFFDLSPTDSTEALQIGEKHVFASRRNRQFLAFSGKRRICDLSMNVDRKSELTPEESEKIGLSNARIGELVFFPPQKRGEHGSTLPAHLGGRVFVSDELHDSLRQILQAGKRPTWLRLILEIEVKDALRWQESHGRISPYVWDLESSTDCSYLDVKSMDVNIHRWRPVRSRLLLALGG